MADQSNIAWLRDRLQLSRAVEATDPAELLAWLEQRRSQNNGSEKFPERSASKVKRPPKAKSKNGQKPKTANKVKKL